MGAVWSHRGKKSGRPHIASAAPEQIISFFFPNPSITLYGAAVHAYVMCVRVCTSVIEYMRWLWWRWRCCGGGFVITSIVQRACARSNECPRFARARHTDLWKRCAVSTRGIFTAGTLSREAHKRDVFQVLRLRRILVRNIFTQIMLAHIWRSKPR